MAEYVLMPERGLRAGDNQPMAREALLSLENRVGEARILTASFGGADNSVVADGIQVLDSLSPDGAKLIECSEETADGLSAATNGLRIAPVVYYYPAVVEAPQVLEADAPAPPASAGVTIRVTVVGSTTPTPLANVRVVLFTDFAKRRGASGVTNGNGIAIILLKELPSRVERLYAFPERDYWAALYHDVNIMGDHAITLERIRPDYPDSLRHFYGKADDTAGQGIHVGIVDTGVAPHPDLAITGGKNLVRGEEENDFGDSGAGHGTHVAGIIGARGNAPSGVRGLAPGASLFSYRVFGKGQEGASNFAIAKAVDQAVTDKCDFINMSLGGGRPDPVLVEALLDARNNGCVPIAASGNEDRSPVSFPGSDKSAVAVAAMGRIGTFPQNTTSSGYVAEPFGTESANFIASFSNIGPQTAFVAPGVGIVSTFPGGYAALDGTSMACPAVVGFAARLLSGRQDLQNAPRNAARSQAIINALRETAAPLGFGANFEGSGQPDLAKL